MESEHTEDPNMECDSSSAIPFTIATIYSATLLLFMAIYLAFFRENICYFFKGDRASKQDGRDKSFYSTTMDYVRRKRRGRH